MGLGAKIDATLDLEPHKAQAKLFAMLSETLDKRSADHRDSRADEKKLRKALSKLQGTLSDNAYDTLRAGGRSEIKQLLESLAERGRTNADSLLRCYEEPLDEEDSDENYRLAP